MARGRKRGKARTNDIDLIHPQQNQYILSESLEVRKSPGVELGGLEVGARVSHNRFGAGTIVFIEGNGGDAKALIDFDANGRKNLLLRFAKLDILQ